MTILESLIIILIITTLARIVQSHIQHQQITGLLDALGELDGDLLKAILQELRKPKP